MLRYLAFVGLGTLLAGCTAASEPYANADGVIGFRYHDGMHSNSVASPSPQAIENARRGVWLWPPADNGRPG